jgi:flavodoxin
MIMEALIIYDSVFGNTGQVAQSIGELISKNLQGQAQTLHVAEVTQEQFQGLRLLVVGSPTRSFRPTEAITKLIKEMPQKQIAGVQVAAFDTRIFLETIDSKALRFVVDKGGYAASTIAKGLQKKGGSLIAQPEGFLVTGEQGPLKEGELKRAEDWVNKLSLSLS